jgi:DNA helicase HerA-like ATPase
MKVTNPNDLKAISKGLEGISSDVEEDIKRLSPGVAMIVSTYIERPILVDIRTRKSKHGGASVPVVKAPAAEKKKEVSQTQEPEVKTEPKKEQAGKESVKKPRTKREMSLYHKMFGSRKT